jgi:uncharacterized protein YndB with AHSA1/START domain
MTKAEVTAQPGTQQILISREFNAPPDLVFKAFTDRELLVQWLGPRRMTMRVDRFDLRDGGTWRYLQFDQDGRQHAFHGVFHGTPSPDGIVQTFEYEGAPGHVSLDTLALEEHGGRTIVRINSVHQSVEARDAMIASGMADGMNEGFERLDQLIEKLVPVG